MPPAGRPANCEPSAADRSWKRGARERANDVFFCLWHKKTSEQSGLCSDVERDTGVEPATSAWEADVLPIYQSRTDLVSEGIITDPRRICKTNPVESAQPAIPAETYALHPMLRQSIGHGSGRRFSPGARAFRRAARRKSRSKQA